MYDILDQFKALLLSVDPALLHYFGRGSGNYTVWTEYELDGLHGGNQYAEIKWRILVERFTTDQDDTIAQALMAALSHNENIIFQYSLRRNVDQEIIYHAWDCEVTSGEV